MIEGFGRSITLDWGGGLGRQGRKVPMRPLLGYAVGVRKFILFYSSYILYMQ